MRRVNVTTCQPGQILAEPIVNDRGLVVVRAGVRLNESLIERLKGLGVWYLFIDDAAFEGIEVLEPLSTRTLYPLVAYLRGLIAEVKAAEHVAAVTISARELMRWVDAVSDEIATLRESFLLYWPTGSDEERWIARTINMSVLAARTLRRIGGVAQARHVVVAAILGELGVWRIGDDLRNAVYTNRAPEALRQHVAESVQLAQAVGGVSSIAKAIVAQHHERCDGSGQPNGRKGEDVHPLARVLGVVDDYLLLVFDRAQPLLPHEALEHLMAGVGYEYDHASVKAFCGAAPVYPVGMEVELSSGERAVVVGASAVTSRPVVRVLSSPNGEPVAPRELNLAEATTHMIVRVINA